MTSVRARRFSVIIPVYNRPEELAELLECLTHQSLRPYEVIVVEDGSAVRSWEVIQKFSDRLPLSYLEKENGGQGFARNFGMEQAKGDFFIILDSDALLEPNYLETVNDYLNIHPIDFYGGPDTDHPDFTPIQKAISYAMTSTFTTGGIRGKKSNLGGTFHPRSFNMGLSRRVWEKTGGFQVTRMGEDIIFSIQAIRLGFRSALIPEAFIYHKRRTQFSQFFKQLRFFGRARINIARFFPEELKIVHFFPAAFFTGLVSIPVLTVVYPPIAWGALILYVAYFLILFLDSLRINKNGKIAFLSVIAAIYQLSAYGIGFIQEGWRKIWEDKNIKYTGTNVEYPS
jgi:glycosyltransferase involved in cell wall biosynthesis